jgi:outer membrane protein assembly factor BamD (BamD/ComL family)
MQSEFLVAIDSSPGVLEDFADRYAKKRLGGLASYMVGNRALQVGNFKKATQYYAIAANAWEETQLHGVAQLAAAVTTVRDGGDSANLRRKLSALISDSQQLSIVRAAALYITALHDFEVKNFAGAREALRAIEKIPEAGIWQTKASILAFSLPESELNQ